MTSPASAPTKGSSRGLLLVCLVGVIWGTIGPAVALVHQRSSLSVPMIGAYRSLAAVAVLIAATLAVGRMHACRSLARRHWRRAVVVGTLTATFQLLFFLAVVLAGVSLATVVGLGSAPVLLLVLTSAQQGRTPSLGQTITVIVAVLGLALVGSSAGQADDVSNATLGILAALGSGTAYALSAEFGAPLSREHDALTVATATTSVVAAVLLPFGLGVAILRDQAIGALDVSSALLVAYLGVVTLAFAYVLLFAGLKTVPSGSAVVATLLEPATAVLIAVAFLGERLAAASLVGTLLIVAAIARLEPRAEPPQPQ